MPTRMPSHPVKHIHGIPISTLSRDQAEAMLNDILRRVRELELQADALTEYSIILSAQRR
jgi:hypothetical protein